MWIFHMSHNQQYTWKSTTSHNKIKTNSICKKLKQAKQKHINEQALNSEKPTAQINIKTIVVAGT